MKTYLYRIRFVMAVIVVTVLPIIITGIVLVKSAEQALLAEKKQKLIAITQQLDFALSKDFDTIVVEAGLEKAEKEHKLQALNEKMQPLTDRIALAHPGIGVGYYSAALDSIVTYGPSNEMSLYIGQSISETHPGRSVMQTRQTDVVIGEQVRGNIMNAMVPLIRNDQVIGYAWANELMSTIDIQLAGMRQSIYAILGIGCMIAAAASGLLVHRFEVILSEIKSGLKRLSQDLSFRLRKMDGEPGEIAGAINNLASDLQASRSRTETIMNSMDSGVLALDQSGHLIAWNETAIHMIGFTSSRANGMHYTEVFTESEALLHILLDTLQNGQAIRDAMWRHQHPDRGVLWLKVSSSIWKNTTEEVLGAIVVLEDRTQWQRMESRLAQAERLAVIGEWATSIAHEVRNPLTAIKAFAQIIEEEWPKDHGSREYTGIIVEEVERLNRFTDELLLFSRPNEESNVPVHVQEVIQHTLKLMEHAEGFNGVNVQLVYNEDIPAVMSSPELLKQVFLNILHNALQAKPMEGRIQIEIKNINNDVHVRVTNEGPPIAEENLLAIFEPFFTTKQTGTGLGLAISQRIVQAYGGHIFAQNTPEGVCFTVILPIRAKGGL
ncbi:two-component system sensor histidine kinase AtoS [Brevibacillus sp. HB1.3]|uniref:two-component system sensor histidine kinase AtoS n=1 Tax=Brevibacillus sp. HB1.3 TaxID=2738842 RepID=UPI001555E4F3|nr:two-component system sensor histidine kinase AtoS [Brevibacillus sp. HB1.3]NQF16792.1 two-component system sensor histidine kinase AtoS [Brevibacillus sp. HB1.3]